MHFKYVRYLQIMVVNIIFTLNLKYCFLKSSSGPCDSKAAPRPNSTSWITVVRIIQYYFNISV